jgi:rRNA pseudouridine-1189 N-methylase Emg1 (Nep1/Mra1 family)
VFAVWKNEIQLIIHTVENKYFNVLNLWNPPLSFNRFRGLMEHLLTKGRLKTNAGLIKLKSGSLLDILKLQEEKKPERIVIALTRYGKKDTFLDFQKKLLKYVNSNNEYI